MSGFIFVHIIYMLLLTFSNVMTVYNCNCLHCSVIHVGYYHFIFLHLPSFPCLQYLGNIGLTECFYKLPFQSHAIFSPFFGIHAESGMELTLREWGSSDFVNKLTISTQSLHNTKMLV